MISRPRRGIDQPDRSPASPRRCGSSARSARPRCERASFSAGASSADGPVLAVRARRSGRSRSRWCPRGSRISVPGISPCTTVSSPPAPPAPPRRRTRAPRRSSGTSASWASSSSMLRSVVAVPAGPARRQHPGHPVQRVDAQAGVVGQRRQPGGRGRARALSSAFSSKVAPGLGRLVVRGRRRRGRAPRRRARRGQDPPQLVELAWRCARRGQPRRHRGRAARSDAAAAVRSAQPCDPARVEQRVELARGRTARPRRCPAPRRTCPSPVITTFMSVSARDVLLVGQVEPRLAVDDADADRRDRAGQRVRPGERACGAQPGDGVGQRDVGPGDRGGAGAAVGLEHVAVEHDGVLAERLEVDARRAASGRSAGRSRGCGRRSGP